MLSARCSGHMLMKLEFSRNIFEKKYSNTKFHENLSSGSRVVPCGRTDTQDEAKYSLLKILRRRIRMAGMKKLRADKFHETLASIPPRNE